MKTTKYPTKTIKMQIKTTIEGQNKKKKYTKTTKMRLKRDMNRPQSDAKYLN